MGFFRVRIRNFTHSNAKKAATKALLRGVWGLENPRATAYCDHLEDVLSLQEISDSDKFRLVDTPDIIGLVNRMRGKEQNPLQDIKNDLQASPPSWMVKPVTEASARKVVNLAIHLWLFTKPETFLWSQDLKDVVRQNLPSCNTPQIPAGVGARSLSSDFSAKNLTRKGGIRMVWTSYLGEHLTFVGKDQLRVFRHASALREYAKSDMRNLYPDDILDETENTLRLLFPPVELKSAKRTRLVAEKEGVDIEAAIAAYASLDLCNYPFWHERLEKVQKTYDAARPKRMKQWWFDRRDKVAWATLWVAVIIFVLTVVFGVIQSVTSIMQVVK